MKKLALAILLLIGCEPSPTIPSRYNVGDIIRFKDTGKTGILERNYGGDSWMVNYADDLGERHFISLKESQFLPVDADSVK